jgi:uncharacterized protein
MTGAVGRAHGSRLLRLAVPFYLGMAAVGIAICLLTGRPWVVIDGRVATPARVGIGAGAGLVLGLLVVGLSRLSVARLRLVRELYRWFGSILGPLSTREVLWLALLSGIGEEIFFRAALQPHLGLWVTTTIFGLLHLPAERRFLLWTGTALLLGLAFGLLSAWSGSVAGAVLAHVTVNALNLRHVSALARTEKE